MLNRLKITKIKSGFAALVVVVIVGAAALTLAVSTALLGVRELEIATTESRGHLAKTFTDGCLDRALLTLRLNPAAGSSSFTDATGQCIITVSDLGAGVYQVVARGIIGEYEQSLTARVTATPTNHSIIINSYSISDQ